MSSLDEAKLNLKKSLNRLEGVVNKKLSVIRENGVNEVIQTENEAIKKESEGLKSKLREANEEINYLRELNHKLQAKIGLEQERVGKLHQKNTEAAKKVDEIISDVKSYLSIN